MLNGKKTYIAAAGMICLGVVAITEGNVEDGVSKIVSALALFGIGHKIDRKE